MQKCLRSSVFAKVEIILQNTSLQEWINFVHSFTDNLLAMGLLELLEMVFAFWANFARKLRCIDYTPFLPCVN
jgi:hypothetical protein